MQLTDLATSLARTAASKLVGGLLGLALALGIVLPAGMSDQLTLAVTGALILASQYGYYVVVRLLEQRWPLIGKLLLWSSRTPTYGVTVPIQMKLVIDHEAAMAPLEKVRMDLERAARIHDFRRR